MFVYIGPPQKCNLLSADSYDGSEIHVKVNCEDGNSTLTRYRIQFRKDGVAHASWGSRIFNASLVQPYVVTGLEPYTTYNLRATARNKHGYETGSGAYSHVVTVTTAQGGEFTAHNN